MRAAHAGGMRAACGRHAAAPQRWSAHSCPFNSTELVLFHTANKWYLEWVRHFVSLHGRVYRRPLPTELVDSRNKKNIETASSDTILTDRSGCLDLTLEATSCTQMERDIRCAILNSRVANSSTPECGTVCRDSGFASESVLSPSAAVLDAFVPTPDFANRLLCHSFRTATSVEGMAESRTDSARTMPTSSSSEMCASWAASKSSFAIPKETENARSDPSDPRAPAVDMYNQAKELPTRQIPLTNSQFTIMSSDVRSVSKDACVMDSVIACQGDLTIVIRRLLINATVSMTASGRGGKAARDRVGSSHRYICAGNIYGCLLSSAIDFVRGPNDRVSDVVRTLHTCLQPAGKSAMSCDGADTLHLLRGFACYHALRSQLQYIPEFRQSGRIDSRYGKKSVALGVSACVYFVLTALSKRADNSTALVMVSEAWIRRCRHMLCRWTGLMLPSDVSPDGCRAELHAERRALERAEEATKHAQRFATSIGLDAYNSVRLQLAFMHKAMWPGGSTLSSETQESLIRWIQSDQFRSDVDVPNHTRPRANYVVNVPLSAVPMLHSRREDNSDESAYDSASSSGSSMLSLSSAGSDDLYDQSRIANEFGKLEEACEGIHRLDVPSTY